MIVFVDLFAPAQGLSIATQRGEVSRFEEKVFSELVFVYFSWERIRTPLGFYV